MKSTMAVVILVFGLTIGGAAAGTDQTEVTPSSPVQRSDAPTEQESDRPPQDATGEFVTDFSLHSVPYTEIRSGGPPKDGIPSIDRPQFVEVHDADRWIRPMEPVIMLRIGPDVRAYPVQIVTWHEIINDTVGGVPVVVTFCPLCNTAIAFDRVIRGQRLEFGTTGRLRYSNLIMYDRQTESWWQQATGEAIAGELTGERLAMRPAPMVAWRDFKKLEPEGRVLSRRTGHDRPYGRNPYVGYDDVRSSPFMYEGPAIPGQLRPLDRVLALEINGASVA